MMLRFLVAALLLAALPACVWAAEREPVLLSADLVEPALLTGPGYRVLPEARVVGLQARFLIETEWGLLAADSVEMLALRVGEMPQLSMLMSADLSEVLRESGMEELAAPLRTAQALGDEPMQRLSRLPGGVLRYFTQRLRGWGERARRLGKRLDQRLSHEGSPYGGHGWNEASPILPAADEPWWDAPVDEVGRLLRSEAGHGRARRAIAKAFGVDPATSNPLLRQRLDALAWAVASQRLAYDRALGLAIPGLALAIDQLQRAESLTALPDEASQRHRNEQRLGRWTGDAQLAYALAWRGAYSPSLLGELLDELDRLAPTSGAEAALEVARMAASEAEARFVVQALRLLQAQRAEGRAGGALVAVGALLGWHDASGEFFLSLPVDHLSWVARVAGYFDHAQVARFPRRTVLLSGGISARAEREISRRGWSLLSFVRYPSAPPYRSPAEAL